MKTIYKEKVINAHADSFTVLKASNECISYLDQTYASLVKNDAQFEEIFSSLIINIFQFKNTLPKKEWELFCIACKLHPINTLIMQDPFSKRALDKPRGYAGDAVLMDYLYYNTPQIETEIGLRINKCLRSIPACSAVRSRGREIGKAIDKLAVSNKKLRVLSIASGHAREPLTSDAFLSGAVAEFVVLDQDQESLDAITTHTSPVTLTKIKASVRHILNNSVPEPLGTYDFIFSSGLFDYLPVRVATKLTEKMFNLLNPNGITFITNYMPNTIFSGYMEAFLDWPLVYRNFGDLEYLSRNIQDEALKTKKIFVDNNNRIAFLELKKAPEKIPAFFMSSEADYPKLQLHK